MKKWILAAGIAVLSTAASAQYGGSFGTGSNPNSHSVQGHTTQSGTYVAPHMQTNPNNTVRDNYGTAPNINPYSGAVGQRRY